MKLLTFTTLYPNAIKPSHGIFVETRLRHLVATQNVESRVVAPVPWFPSQKPLFGRYADFAKVPPYDLRYGLQVFYPRYLTIPKFGMSVSPFFLANSVKPTLAKLIDEGFDFDCIDAHYFYPDGVAAALLGKYFNKPTTITARGSDLTLLAQYSVPRKLIQWAAKRAAKIITVCDALQSELLALGVPHSKISTLRNGVDLELFQPVNRTQTRDKLGVSGFTLLSVGNLVPVKGHDIALKALALVKDVQLFIAGSGPLRKKLENLAEEIGVRKRVTFLGALSQQELRDYYGAADALLLASSREGWANVLLESMACGTPVIASKVWGTPEVVASPEAGVLMRERSPQAVVEAIQFLRSNKPDRSATRRYAEKFSWDDTSEGQIKIFRTIAAERSLAATHA